MMEQQKYSTNNPQNTHKCKNKNKNKNKAKSQHDSKKIKTWHKSDRRKNVKYHEGYEFPIREVDAELTRRIENFERTHRRTASVSDMTALFEQMQPHSGPADAPVYEFFDTDKLINDFRGMLSIRMKPDPVYAPYLEYAENIIMSTYLLYKVYGDIGAMSTVVLCFIKLQIKRPICSLIDDLFKLITGTSLDEAPTNGPIDPPGDMELHSGEWHVTQKMREWKNYLHLPAFSQFGNLVSLLVMAGLVPEQEITLEGFTVFSAKAMDKQKSSGDILDCVIETIAFFMDAGYAMIVDKDLGALFKGRDEITKLDDDLLHLHSNIDRVVNGSYQIDTGITVPAYHQLMLDCEKRLRRLSGSVCDRVLKNLLQMRLQKLTTLIIRYEAANPTAGMRTAPFGICVYGGSSLGKSSVVNMLCKSILMANEFPSADKNFCTIQNNDKFYSSFKADCACVILDDVANTVHTKAESNPADRIVSIVNNIQYYAPKAEAHEKSAIMVRPRVLGVTTNVKHLDAHNYSNEPISVLRRLEVFATVTVRPEVATGGKLDSAKVRAFHLNPEKFPNMRPDPNYRDYWLFKLERVVGRENGVENGPECYDFETIVDDLDPPGTPKSIIPKIGVLMKDVNIFQVIHYLGKRSFYFFENQDVMVKENAEFSGRAQMCKTCMQVASCCTCTGIGTSVQKLSEMVPHSVGLNWMVDMIASRASSAILSTTKNWFNLFTFNMLDCLTLQWSCDASLYKYLYKVDSSPFSLLSIIPPTTRETWWFQQLYYRSNLHVMRAWTRWGLLASMAVSFMFDTVYAYKCRSYCYAGARERIAFFGGFIGLATVTSNRLAHYMITDELSNRPFYKIMDVKKHETMIKYTLIGGLSLVTGLVFIQTCKKIYTTLNTSIMKPQGNLCPSPEEIKVRDDEKNVWQHTVTPMPINPDTRNMTSDQLANATIGNLLHLERKVGMKIYTTGAVAVCANVMMLPLHFLCENNDITNGPREQSEIRIIRADVKSSGASWTETIYSYAVTQVGNHDLCVVSIHAGGTFKNILKYTTDEHIAGQAKVIMRTRQGIRKDGNACVVPGTNTYAVSCFKKPVTVRGGKSTYDFPTFAGMCMSVLISKQSSPSIIGYHIAGKTDKYDGCYISPSLEEICYAMSQNDEKCGTVELHSFSALESTRFGRGMNFVPEVSDRAPIAFLRDYNFTLLGSIGTQASYRSEIKNTYILPYVESAFGITQKWGKPRFWPTWKPWADSLQHMAQPRHSLDPRLLKRARDDYLSHIKPKWETYMKSGGLHRPLSEKEVINGIHGMRFIDAMNFQSSVGYPLTGAKSKIVEGPPGEKRWKEPEVIRAEIHKMEESYSHANKHNCIFKACLKDEATKLTSEKTRVFFAGDLPLQIGWRKYGLAIARFMALYPLDSECAVGINSFSDEWQQMIDHITHNGTREDTILAGDYSKWDLRLPSQLINVAFSILIELAQASPEFTDEDIVFMRGLITDTIYYTCHYNGTLIMLHGGMPSGHNLTALMNSICNALLIRMAFFSIYPDATSFRKYCSLMTYGDDMICGIAFCMSKFNHISCREFLARYDIVFTMPDKVSAPREFLHIDNVDFLKRKNTFIPEIGICLGALDIDSILKSMCCKGKSDCSNETHAVSVIDSAAREFFVHGREFYDRNVLKLREIAGKADLVLPRLDLTFDELVDEWKEQYETRCFEGQNSEPSSSPDYSGMFVLEIEDDTDLSGLTSRSTLLGDFEWKSLLWPTPLTTTRGQDSYPDTKIQEGDTPPSAYLGRMQPHSGETMLAPTTETGVAALTNATMATHHEVELINNNVISLSQDSSRSLDQYLSRPVRLWTTTIDQVRYDKLNPLFDILKTPRVRDKIRGYAYMTGKLHIKVMVNAPARSAGAMIVALHPWHTRDNGLDFIGDVNKRLSLTQLTSLPHIMVDFSSEAGGEISLPIMAPTNGLNISDFEQINSCFGLHMNTFIAPRFPPDVTNTSVTVNILGWLTDVVLTGTTLSSELPVPQSGEYSIHPRDQPGTIHSMASKALRGILDGLVGFGSQLATKSIYAMAGLSKPFSLDPIVQHVNRGIGFLANFNGSDSVPRLSGDTKQEVRIDTQHLGFDEGDQMDIMHIAQKWSLVRVTGFLANTTLSGSHFVIPVSPTLSELIPNTGGPAFQVPSNVAFMSLPFSKWRGELEFKFVAVCSAFARGKIKFCHDCLARATYRTLFDPLEFQALNNVVWDISQTKELIIKVPWTSNLAFKPIPFLHNTGSNFEGPSSAGDDYSSPGYNGNLLMSAITSILDPGLEKIDILIYVRAGDDFVLGDPRPVLGNYTFAGLPPVNPRAFRMDGIQDDINQEDGYNPIPDYTTCNDYFKTIQDLEYAQKEEYLDTIDEDDEPMKPQGYIGETTLDGHIMTGDVPDSSLEVNIAGIDSDKEMSDTMLELCIGEKYSNIRQVIKRYTHVATRKVDNNNNTAGFDQAWVWNQPDKPSMKGWQGASSLHSSAVGQQVTYARDSFLSYYSTAFLGYRGGINHKYMIRPLTLSQYTLQGMRSSAGYSELFRGMITGWPLTPSGGASDITRYNDTRSGAVFCSSTNNQNIEFNTPFYADAKFLWSQDRVPHIVKDVPDGGYSIGWHALVLYFVGRAQFRVEKFTAAADDFSFFYYLYPPHMVEQSPPPHPI